MDATELSVCATSFLFHQGLFHVFDAGNRSKSKSTPKSNQSKAEQDDRYKLFSCYLSHIHCAVTIVSCLAYWATRPVDVLSPKFMVEVNLSHGNTHTLFCTKFLITLIFIGATTSVAVV